MMSGSDGEEMICINSLLSGYISSTLNLLLLSSREVTEMTENEGAEPRYMPACQDTTKIIPWYDFLLKLVVVSAACREKSQKYTLV